MDARRAVSLSSHSLSASSPDPHPEEPCHKRVYARLRRAMARRLEGRGPDGAATRLSTPAPSFETQACGLLLRMRGKGVGAVVTSKPDPAP